MTREALALRLGPWTRTVASHAAKRHLVKAGRGYLLWASTRALVACQSEALAGRNDEVREARGRLELAKAKMAELRLAEAQGRVLDAAEVTAAWSGILLTTCNRILAVPKRLQMFLGHLSRSDFAAIGRELREALTELGEGRTPAAEEAAHGV